MCKESVNFRCDVNHLSRLCIYYIRIFHSQIEIYCVFPAKFTKDKKVKPSYYRSGQALKFGKVVSSKHRPLLPTRRFSWYSFLLETESAGRIVTMKNSNDTIANRTGDLPVCSTVPQPSAPQSVTAVELAAHMSRYSRQLLFQPLLGEP